MGLAEFMVSGETLPLPRLYLVGLGIERDIEWTWRSPCTRLMGASVRGMWTVTVASRSVSPRLFFSFSTWNYIISWALSIDQLDFT